MSLSVYYGLLFLAATGLVLVVSANDFLMIFLGIELVGIPGFILTGYLRNSEKSGEGAVKFFLIGAFSSAMLAYGISILYGVKGFYLFIKPSDGLPVYCRTTPLWRSS